VDIGSAAPDRIQQYLVDEAHDRRILDVVARDRVAELLVAAANLERFEIDALIVAEVGHLRVDLLEPLVELALQLVVFDHDRFDREPGLELDFIDRL